MRDTSVTTRVTTPWMRDTTVTTPWMRVQQRDTYDATRLRDTYDATRLRDTYEATRLRARVRPRTAAATIPSATPAVRTVVKTPCRILHASGVPSAKSGGRPRTAHPSQHILSAKRELHVPSAKTGIRPRTAHLRVSHSAGGLDGAFYSASASRGGGKSSGGEGDEQSTDMYR